MASISNPTVRPSKIDLPKPDSDFYQMTASLTESDREVLRRVRTFMEGQVAH